MTAPYHNKALPPGTVLREWRLEQVLGVGGFGIVYRARGIYFDELVAIKEYFPSAISDRRDGDTVVPNDSSAEEVHALGLKKFVEEAKLLWNLSTPTRHPNIVSVRSLFEIHGTAYMVMDFESGVSLSQLLRKGQTFNEEKLLSLIKPIAEGLERAHRVGVLHRDIKPANILVGEDGRPVLIDFGSARFESSEATNTKVTFHTPPYAAIEQYVKTYVQGPWTDIYALGVVLYECVTGEKPPEVLERLHGGLGEVLAGKPWPGYSRPFLRAIDAAMTIRPEERPRSISQWLTMFDAEDKDTVGSYDDDATRIGTLAEMVDPSLATIEKQAPSKVVLKMPGEAAPQPVAAAALAEAGVSAKAAAPAKPFWQPLIGIGNTIKQSRVAQAGILLLVLCVGIFAFLRGGMNSAPSKTATAAGATAGPNGMPIVAPPGVDPAAIASIGQLPSLTAALIDDAKRAGRPRSEIGRLQAGKANIETAIADIQKLAPDPKAGAAVMQRLGELNDLTLKMAGDQSSALSRAARGQLANLKKLVPWGDLKSLAQASTPEEQSAAASLQSAKSQLDAATADVSRATDPASAIAATHRAFAAWQSFAGAAGMAAPLAQRLAAQNEEKNALPLKQAAFTLVEKAARETASRVAALAAGGKPGLFANKAKRDSYKLRQDNATKAKAQLTELDRLAAAVRSATTAPEIEAARSQAALINTQLYSLYSASYAAQQAAPQKGQAATTENAQ